MTIKDFAFTPDKVTVKVGATVTWTDNDPFKHSVVSKDGTFHSDDLASGAQFTHTEHR